MEKTLLDQKSLFHNPFLELTYQKNLFIFQVPFGKLTSAFGCQHCQAALLGGVDASCGPFP